MTVSSPIAPRCEATAAADEHADTLAPAPAEPPEGVRTRIAAAASNLFAEKGYAGTSLREIAAQAEVTKPMIYYYFGNKEGLYRTLLQSAYEGFADRLQTIVMSQASTRSKLVAIAQTHMEGALHHLDLLRLLMSHALGPKSGAPSFDVRGFCQAQASALRTILGQSKPGLSETELELFITLFWNAMGTFCELSNAGAKPAPELPERLVGMLWEGLAGRCRGAATVGDAPRPVANNEEHIGDLS